LIYGKTAAVLLFFASLTAFAAPSPKLSAEQTSVLEDARAYALQYTQRLPDFICTQTTRREVTAHMSGSFASVVLDSLSDIVEEQLSYVGGKEKYVVLTIDGRKAPGITHAQLDGAISWGEFGSLTSQIFDPASHTVFSWDREERVDGRSAWAFKFRVPKESGTTVIDQPTNRSIVVSYSGKVVIDPETKDVLEISSTLDVPGTFSMHNVMREVLYADQDIGGRKYCLPAHSEMRMEDRGRTYDNKIDFKDYHHFTSESTIHFDSDNPK
jgi:hypothetical protein